MLLAALVVSACASTAGPVDLAPLESPFRVCLNGRCDATVVLLGVHGGAAVNLLCYVPDRYSARYVRYGLEGFRMSEGPNDRNSYRLLVERIECGVHVASCTLSSGERRETILEVNCPDGSQVLER